MLLRDSIYREIRRAILTCELPPGQELHEHLLVERFHVSRSPIRDALLRLEQENLVTVLPRQGYRVNPLSMSDAEEIFGLRLLIEPACAATAATRASDTALQTLNQFRGFADSQYTQTGYIDHNESFHRAILNLSGNRRLAAVALDLVELVERLVRISMRASFRHENVRGLCTEHEAIIDAVQARDGGRAAHVSHAHLQATHARIRLGLLAAEQQGSEWPAP